MLTHRDATHQGRPLLATITPRPLPSTNMLSHTAPASSNERLRELITQPLGTALDCEQQEKDGELTCWMSDDFAVRQSGPASDSSDVCKRICRASHSSMIADRVSISVRLIS